MPIDIAKIRKETPGTENVLHFNNAGASLVSHPVLDAVVRHLARESAIGGYEAADAAEDTLEHTYEALARLLNCASSEIAVIENATRAWDMAFYSMPFGPDDRILTAVSEYASNYIAYLQIAKKTGAVVEVVPNDGQGQIDIEALRNMIDPQVKLISVTHVPTNGGLINPAAAVGRIANEAGIPYLLDACQSVGQMPIDVRAIGCDMLSATGRKYLRGPRGTGFLYVKRTMIEKLEPPMLDLHAATWTGQESFEIRDDARRFENWECNFAGKIGLGVAADYASDLGLDAIWERIQALAGQLREGLGAIEGVTVRDLGAQQCGIVSFDVAGHAPEAVKARLTAASMNVSVSPAAWTRIDMTSRGIEKLVRASVHYYNTADEVDLFVEMIRSIAREGR